MNLKNIKYMGWGVLLLGLFFNGCGDDEKAEVMPETTLSVDASDLVFSQEGGSKSLQIKTNRGWGVVRNEGGWVEITGAALGDPGDHEVILQAVANSGAHSRTAKFTVTAAEKSEVIEFTQFGMEPEILPGQKQMNISFDGGVYDMIVHSNLTPLTATASADWLSVTSNPLQSASYLYKITVTPNTGAARTGTITFAADGTEAVVTVEQAAFEARFTLINKKLDVTALTENAELVFQTNTAWNLEWGQTGKPAWITAVTPTSGKAHEEATVTFTVLPNTEVGAQARSAAFRIKYGNTYEDFTLNQAEPVISENGTRETDSLALAEFYTKLQGVKPEWDLSLPMEKWGPMRDNADRVSYAVSFDPDGRVIGLTLNEFTIEGEIPEAIGRLYLLRRLTFYYLVAKNMSYPASFKNLQDLQQIDINFDLEGGNMELPDLSKNKALYQIAISGQNPEFTDPKAPVIGINGIAGMENLETLTLTYLNAGNLPDLSASRKLQSLIVRNSDITRFPTEIADFPELRSLELKNCNLTGELPDIFTHTALASIDISANQMTGELPMAMFTSEKLLSAIVSNNNFTGTLPKELSTVSNLNDFSCRNNRMGGDGMMLPEEILKDWRWKGMIIGGGGAGSGGWFGVLNICVQQPGYGWDNCQ